MSPYLNVSQVCFHKSKMFLRVIKCGINLIQIPNIFGVLKSTKSCSYIYTRSGFNNQSVGKISMFQNKVPKILNFLTNNGFLTKLRIFDC